VLEAWRSGKGDVQINYFGSQGEAIRDPVTSGELLKQAAFLGPDDAADFGSIHPVVIRGDVGGAQCSQIRDRFDSFSFACHGLKP
jgi:hypothetical protein